MSSATGSAPFSFAEHGDPGRYGGKAGKHGGGDSDDPEAMLEEVPLSSALM